MTEKHIYIDVWNPMENRVDVVQGEVSARYVVSHIHNSGVPLNLEGASVQVYGKKPDGTGILNDCEVLDGKRGIVSIPMTQQMSIAPGEYEEAGLQIIRDGKVLKVLGLSIVVHPAYDYDEDISEDELTAVQEAIDRSNYAASRVPSIGENGNWYLGDEDTGESSRGKDGVRGRGLLKVSTAPTEESSTVDGYSYKYKFPLSKVIDESGVSKVLTGDVIKYSYYEYSVGYVGASYAFADTRTSIRGTTGTSVTVSSVSESTEDGGSNVVTFSDGKTLTVKNGTQGSPGKAGANGVTPVKGVDYYSDADKAEFSEYIASELAKRGQLKPEFANSIADCTDTSKLYVLPDGYIYGCVLTTSEGSTTPNFTNQIPISTDTGSAVYNGTGFKDGVKLSTSGGGETAGSGVVATGFIPINGYGTSATSTGQQVIRFKGIPALPSDGNVRIMFYNASKAFMGYQTASNNFVTTPAENKSVYTLGADGYIDSVDVSGYTRSLKNASKQAYFFRVCSPGINANSVITLNEEITYTTVPGGTTTEWKSTGHAFVPADYEDRIIQNETDISALKSRVNLLESGAVSSSGVESYVQNEAERVAGEVYKCQNANTFTFLAVSDMHYLPSHANIAKSNVHAGQGMDLVRKGVNVDFAVCLGDNGWGSGVVDNENRATIESGIAEIRGANKLIDSAFRGIPNFRIPGNHDSLIYNFTFNGNDYLDSSELFPLYGAYNRGAVFHDGNKECGYCYRDFDDWKLRVICVNTSDIKGLTPSDTTPDVYVSGTQGKWFAETLDLSGKSDASDWNILILSHAPLDWGVNCIFLCDILKAYIDGGSVSITRDGVAIFYNYSGKNTATIIGNCHGHNHNFQVDNLRKLISGTSATEAISLKRFCIPNACDQRTNEKGENSKVEILDIEYGEATSYEKVPGTEQDTAFCVVTVDTVARKIHAHAYGAGYDREISY